jgi:hypothetical protein
MDKLIEQAIKNCKIVRYKEHFEQVCKEYKRLLDAENEQLNLADVMVELPVNHVCRYLKAMNQPYPRLCVDCGKPEGN